MNRKCVGLLFVSLISFAAWADIQTAESEDSIRKREAERLERVGGLVNPPKTNKAVLILDARTDNAPDLSAHALSAERLMQIACERKTVNLKGDECPRAVAYRAKKEGAGAVILFYSKDGDPSLSVFPEDGIALVNVKALECKDDFNRYSRRVAKEFWRAFGFALGAYGAGGQGMTVFKPAYSMNDIDALPGFRLSPAQMAAVGSAKVKLGIFAKDPVPYSRAAKEGWAPAPTNAVQKMYFDRFSDPTARFKSDFGD